MPRLSPTKSKPDSGAVFDGRFRYHLWRTWDETLPRLCFVMLNPSTADETHNDPTIARCVNFARRWSYGHLDVVNVFAYRATASDKLKRVRDPIGPRNDSFISETVARSDSCILAWGNHGLLHDRASAVLSLLSEHQQLLCFGVTKLGQPRHPLYVASAAPLIPFGETGVAALHQHRAQLLVL